MILNFHLFYDVEFLVASFLFFVQLLLRRTLVLQQFYWAFAMLTTYNNISKICSLSCFVPQHDKEKLLMGFYFTIIEEYKH